MLRLKLKSNQFTCDGKTVFKLHYVKIKTMKNYHLVTLYFLNLNYIMLRLKL